MKIGIDISGGDFAPKANVLGAILAQQHLPDDVTIVLIGKKEEAEELLKDAAVNSDSFQIVDAPDVI